MSKAAAIPNIRGRDFRDVHCPDKLIEVTPSTAQINRVVPGSSSGAQSNERHRHGHRNFRMIPVGLGAVRAHADPKPRITS